MRDINTRNIDELLEEVNEQLIKFKKSIEFVIVGGTAFLLKGWVDRVTKDIDLINKENKKIIGMLSEVLEIDINNHTTVPSFKYIFEGWNDSKTLLKEMSNLKVFVPEDEFLIATKFFTRRNDRDITNAAYGGELRINRDKLEKIVIDKVQKYEILRPMLKERMFEIMEFYEVMGWNYEESNIKKLLHKQI